MVNVEDKEYVVEFSKSNLVLLKLIMGGRLDRVYFPRNDNEVMIGRVYKSNNDYDEVTEGDVICYSNGSYEVYEQ